MPTLVYPKQPRRSELARYPLSDDTRARQAGLMESFCSVKGNRATATPPAPKEESVAETAEEIAKRYGYRDTNGEPLDAWLARSVGKRLRMIMGTDDDTEWSPRLVREFLEWTERRAGDSRPKEHDVLTRGLQWVTAESNRAMVHQLANEFLCE